MKFGDLLKKFRADLVDYFVVLKRQSAIHGLKRDFNGLYQEIRDEASPIFVLSTGRCGTMLFTKLLDSCEDIISVHEPHPELSYHSSLAFEDPRDSDALKMGIDMSRYEYIRNAHLLGKRYAETNNRISFFAYYLAELYPNARFVHLIRHPEDFIRSGVKRNWYSGSTLYDEGRIKTERFDSYPVAEKVAGLWLETNKFIHKFAEEFPERTYTLKSEELFTEGHKIIELFQKLSIKKYDEATIERIRKRKMNSSRSKGGEAASELGEFASDELKEFMSIYNYKF